MPFIFYNAFPIACVIAASVVMLREKEGWGWLLLMAFLFAVVPANRRKDNN